jgi:hypothetical protein
VPCRAVPCRAVGLTLGAGTIRATDVGLRESWWGPTARHHPIPPHLNPSQKIPSHPKDPGGGLRESWWGPWNLVLDCRRVQLHSGQRPVRFTKHVANSGIMLCVACVGAHRCGCLRPLQARGFFLWRALTGVVARRARHLGVHISKPFSLHLDDWDEEMKASMLAMVRRDTLTRAIARDCSCLFRGCAGNDRLVRTNRAAPRCDIWPRNKLGRPCREMISQTWNWKRTPKHCSTNRAAIIRSCCREDYEDARSL